MNNTIKVKFNDEESFTVYYITEEKYETEEDFKILFKYISNYLDNRYNKPLSGFYDVDIYYGKKIYILEFNFIDYYGKNDFNVTLFLNTVILYEYENMDLLDCQKIYYKDKFYTEIENIIDDIKLYEYGNIIYGKEVDKVLNKGILFS